VSGARDVLTISGLAAAANVNIETIRYYERRGLLSPPARTGAGYRQFTADDVWRLAFIRRAKDLGFTLTEIGDLLDGDGNDGRDGKDGTDDRDARRSVLDVLAAAQAKLAAVDGEIEQLRRRRDQLARLVQTCETGNPDDCVDLSAS
jgi:DNA-binding transcriptional MerR regulator